MISHELKAQASLAYHNWKVKNPDLVAPVTEEEFVAKFEQLQASYNRGLLKRSEFDQRIDDLLRNPGMALSVTHFTPQEKPTDALLRELDQLKKGGILNDEEYEMRRSELLFQRGVDPNQAATDVASTGGVETAEQVKARLAGYLEELLRNGILSHSEYAMAQQRLKS